MTLNGYEGRYLELSVAADWGGDADAEFDSCDIEPIGGLRDFVSWLGNGQGERYQQVAGQLTRCGSSSPGQRLLVDAADHRTLPKPTAPSRRPSWSRFDSPITPRGDRRHPGCTCPIDVVRGARCNVSAGGRR